MDVVGVHRVIFFFLLFVALFLILVLIGRSLFVAFISLVDLSIFISGVLIITLGLRLFLLINGLLYFLG